MIAAAGAQAAGRKKRQDQKEAEGRIADDRWKRFSGQIFATRILSSNGVNNLLVMWLHAREFEASAEEEQWTASPRSVERASSAKPMKMRSFRRVLPCAIGPRPTRDTLP